MEAGAESQRHECEPDVALNMRACIYARFSTDKQRETSIEDQARVCRARIDREGWQLVDTFSDMETSGRTLIAGRAGAARMLEQVAGGAVDVVVLESLDRLARDLVEQEQLVRRLEHRGLRIVGVNDGYDTQNSGRGLMRAVRGAINESYIVELGHKTHRGLAGQIERGFHAGGISYGYRSVVAGVDTRGMPIGHRLEVDAEQARWVRWIFQQYAAGVSCQKIAAELNELQVPAPGARRRTIVRATWCVSALYGSPAKGSGVLNNEIYIGRYIWNRSQWTKDPDTRKRVRADRPRSEWSIEERPNLRIIDAGLWEKVRGRMDKPARAGGTKGAGRPARSLFGGMLKCGKCGGSVVATSASLYGCTAHKDRGRAVCTGVSVPRKATDVRLLSLVQDEVLAPTMLAQVRRELAAIISLADRKADPEQAKKRLHDVHRDIMNLTDAIATVGLSDALRGRLAAAEIELKGVQQTLAPLETAKPRVDAIMAGYKRMVIDLRDALATSTERARPVLHQILGDVRVVEEGDQVFAEFEAPAQRLLVAAAGGTYLNSGCGDRI
ncbi:MAG: Recombinase [Betaproteobacteria bacterium]|nr:Recombinase [Betaproteobacteria bacterium]